jgi:uncharacterized membrane protein
MKEKVRYTSIDLLRGLAIIVMIEVHVFNAFLLPELRQTGWFSILNFINGLIAPSFLFVSGFAFQVSSGGKLDEMRTLGKSFWKKIARIFQIIIIGYVLHLPFYSLSKIINQSTPKQIESFFAVDVLQCIGFGLLFLFTSRLIIKSDKIYHYFLISVLFLILIFSPAIWQIDLQQFVYPVVGNYFNKMHGSLFPIFPWLNFLLAGAIYAKYFVEAVSRNEEQKFVILTAITGLLVLLLGHIFFSGLLPNFLTSKRPHPIFYIERLGYVFVLLSICWFGNKKYNLKKSFMMDASRESLLVYWLHLIIIYGMFWNGNSLAGKIGMTQGVLESSILTMVLIAMMILAAKIWGWLKIKYPTQSKIFIRVFVGILLLSFFFF